MRGKAHPPELRASAEALLMAGHTQSEVCGLTKLPKATVSGIASQLGDRLELVRTRKNDDSREDYRELLVGYFSAALRAMTNQAEVFGDPDYCRGQDADKLGIAHGILGDKLAGIATTAKALGLFEPPPAELPAPVIAVDD
jgi:hypothetical protein